MKIVELDPKHGLALAEQAIWGRLLTFSTDGAAMPLPYNDKISAEIADAIWAGPLTRPTTFSEGRATSPPPSSEEGPFRPTGREFRPASEIASVADARQYLADRARRIEDEAYQAVQEDAETLARLGDY